jgi:signal transduction histidine kinase
MSSPQRHRAVRRSIRVALMVGAMQALVITVGWYFLYQKTHERVAEGVEDIILQSNEHMARLLLETIGQLKDEQLDFGTPEWNRVQHVIEDAELPSGGFACVLDESGAIMCHPEIRENPGLRDINLAGEVFLEMESGRSETLSELEGDDIRKGEMRFLFDGKHYIATTVMGGGGLRLLVHQPVSGLTAASRHLTRGLIALTFGIGLGVVALTVLGAYLISRRHDRVLVEWNQTLDQKVAERTQQLEQALDRARVAVRARDEFLNNLSHEIRTPMNGVLGTLELIRSLGLTKEQEELAGTMEESGHDLVELLSRLLDYSRLMSEGTELRQVELDPAELVRNCVARIQRDAFRKHLTVSTSCDRDVPDRLVGDVESIRHVLTNLLDNALKFTEKGGIEVRAELAPTSEPASPVLRLTVRDTGIGISSEVRERIFEPFWQVDSSMSRSFGGLGLGLATCSQVAQRLGGTLAVESAPGQGSTFHLDVPLRNARVRDPQGSSTAA